MPRGIVHEDPWAVAAAARGEDNSVWSQSEARWMLMRTPVEHAHQVPMWSVWVVTCVLSAGMSLLVILVVLLRKRTRSQPYNHYIVGLAIPDLVFSGLCAVTCWLHTAHAGYYDGGGDGWMCDFQGFYCTFGIAGSLWVNVLVTHDLRRLTRSMNAMVEHRPITTASVYARLSVAYALALAIAAVANYGYLLGVDARAVPLRGIACLPSAYSGASQAFFLAFTLNLMLLTPLCLIAFFSYRIYADFRAFNAPARAVQPPGPAARRPLWPWSEMSLRTPLSRRAKVAPDEQREPDAAGGGGGAEEEGVQAVDELVSQSQRLQVIFFSRLLLILFGMWLPFFIPYVVVVPYHVAGGWAWFMAGTYSHLQGLVSAIAYAHKPDIREEIGALFCRQRPSRRGSRWSDEADGLAELGGGGGAAAAVTSPVWAGRPSAIAGGGASSDERATMRALSEEAQAHILALSRAPMLVVGWEDWLRAGAIPRSDEGRSREVRPEDAVVFISHRWWGVGSLEPDDESGTKYALITKGVRRILAAHELPARHVAIWIDFACIDQLHAGRMALGISSLISYAARSAFVLIPVEPTAEAARALARARHPIELPNFGERAWCRLETFTFVCLSEVMQRAAVVYAFTDVAIRTGRPRLPVRLGGWPHAHGAAPLPAAAPGAGPAAPRARRCARASAELPPDFDERIRPVMLPDAAAAPPPAVARGHACGLFGAPAACAEDESPERAPPAEGLLSRGLRLARRARLRSRGEVFRPLLTTTHGQQGGRQPNLARFSQAELPSAGKLTVEADRPVIEAMERSVRERFVQHSILAEKLRRSLPRGLRKECRLDFRQLEGQHLPFLAASLLADPSALGELCSLSLRGNLLRGAELGPFAMAVLCAPGARSLSELRLGRNERLGVAGIEALAAALASPACHLRALHLDSCALQPAAGHAIADGLRRSRSLRELNLADNALDNGAVMALVEARNVAHARFHASALIHVERNPISPAVYKLVVIGRIALLDLSNGASRRSTAARSSRRLNSSGSDLYLARAASAGLNDEPAAQRESSGGQPGDEQPASPSTRSLSRRLPPSG